MNLARFGFSLTVKKIATSKAEKAGVAAIRFAGASGHSGEAITTISAAGPLEVLPHRVIRHQPDPDAPSEASAGIGVHGFRCQLSVNTESRTLIWPQLKTHTGGRKSIS